MREQLGIQALRPGPSGNPSSPDAANTNETKANPYPELPGLLTLKNGAKISSARDWWKLRRPEIVEDLAWRQHNGGHEDRSNMMPFISWANRRINR